MVNFVTYSDYRIVLASSTTSFLMIFFILLIVIGITSKRTENHFFDIPTTTSLRGVAVLFLIFSHLSIKCLQDKMFFNLGGYWAVIVFLFISGYGLYQSYGLSNTENDFWKKRVSKLYIPLWITLALFIILDHLLIKLHHPLLEIALNFLGFHFNGVLVRVNAVAWFVEYVMVLYFIFWIVSKLSFSEEVKILILLFLCFSVYAMVRYTPVRNYHSIWLQYTIVFPTGIIFGKYKNVLQALLSSKIKSRLLLLILSLISVAVFYKWNQLVSISGSNILRPLSLIISIVLVSSLIETLNFQSTFLLFIGTYSYEIYLLHAPFMVKYDFFLYRKPFVIYFFFYFVVLLILSYMLSKISNMINGNLFVLQNEKHNKANAADAKSRAAD
ncbi:MAG: acyltransferase [Candidatus Electrothrix sp. GM3_4]|nr:acyltransferase [Candidatus Electrothrix sp. GM3_4]